MELALSERKTRWIGAELERLKALQAATEAEQTRQTTWLELARFAGRPDLVERFDARLIETRRTLTNIRWALEKLARGETF